MENMFNLSGKTFVVIGGAGLIGTAFSRALALQGSNVVIAENNESKALALVAELEKNYDGTIMYEAADVANGASLEKLARHAVQKFRRIDGVVNATYPRTPNYGKSFDEATQKDILENLDLQLGSCFSTVRAFASHMKTQNSGSIVLLGSIYGIVAPRFDIYKDTNMVNPPEYAAAKGGTIALARYFASLLGPHNIRVNTISPGGVLDGQPKPFLREYAKHARLAPGMLAPEDLGGALVFLFSDASKKVTGHNLVVDGGWTI